MASSPSALFILVIYAKRSNCLRFRKVKLKFIYGDTIQINENFIKGNKLNQLLQIIKKATKKEYTLRNEIRRLTIKFTLF